MDEVSKHLTVEGLAYAIVAGLALLTLVGLFAFVPALRQRWLPLPRLRPGAWTGNEVFLSFCVFLGFTPITADILLAIGFFTPLIGPAPDSDAPIAERSVYQQRSLVISSPLALALVLGMVMGMMYARTHTRPHQYGLTWSRPAANVALGLAAFLVSRPAVMAIFVLAVLVFPQAKPPYFEFAKKSGLPEWEWALFAFQTTLAAPVLEEVLCRGILQGWLRRAALTGHIMLLAMCITITAYTNLGAFGRMEFASLGFIIVLAGGYAAGLVWLKRRFALSDDELKEWQVLPCIPPLDNSLTATEEEARAVREQARSRDEQRFNQWADANATLAIYGSAMFFAAMHSNWPGPIALFPMGLVLGWMARRTQSLVGPITFHALFNLTTFIYFYAMTQSAD